MNSRVHQPDYNQELGKELILLPSNCLYIGNHFITESIFKILLITFKAFHGLAPDYCISLSYWALINLDIV